MQKTGMEIAMVVAAYWGVSISMVFLNKYLLSGINLEAPIFITWFQCIVAVLFCFIMGKVGEHVGGVFTMFPPPNIEPSKMQTTMPLSIVFIGMILFNNLCLKYLGVAFYNVGRSLTTVFQVAFTYLLLQQTTSPRAMFCCAILIAGFLLGVDQENSANSAGLSWSGIAFGVLASICVSLNSIFVKRILPLMNDNEWKVTFYNNINASLICLPLIYITGEHVVLLQFPNLYEMTFWMLMTVSGLFGVAIAIVTVLQIKFTSPLTHNVSGTAKACAQTVLAVWWFLEMKSWLWWISNFMVLGGSMAYAQVRRMEMEAAKQQAPVPKV